MVGTLQNTESSIFSFTGAEKNTPASAIKRITGINISPIHSIVKAEARIAVFCFQLKDNWNPHSKRHAAIFRLIINPIITMGMEI